MPVHSLDVTNAESTYVYYQSCHMIAHRGRLYGSLFERDFHPYRQYIATEPPAWACLTSPFIRSRIICLMHEHTANVYIIASELSECFSGFTARHYVMAKIKPALWTIQRFWRRRMLLKRVHLYAPLFVDALSKRPQTLLEGVSADVLQEIQTLALRRPFA